MNLRKQVLALSTEAKRMLTREDATIPKGQKYAVTEKSCELYNRAMRQLGMLKGKTLGPADVAFITRVAAELLDCNAALVRPLAQDFLHVLMEIRTLDLLAWQIAGNRKVVQTREVSLYNNRVIEQAWMAGRITNVVKCPSTGDQYAKIKLMDGPGAGFFIHALLSDNRLKRLSHVLGAIKKGTDKRIRGLPDLRACCGCEVLVYTSGNYHAYTYEVLNQKRRILRSSNSELASWLRTTPKQKKHNLHLMQERAKPCINGFQVTCHDCNLGYDSCIRGCHPTTLSNVETFTAITLKGKNLWPTKTLEKA